MERVECVVCRQVLGIYEPVVVRVSGGYRRTSLAKEPALAADGVELFHPDCSGVDPTQHSAADLGR